MMKLVTISKSKTPKFGAPTLRLSKGSTLAAYRSVWHADSITVMNGHSPQKSMSALVVSIVRERIAAAREGSSMKDFFEK